MNDKIQRETMSIFKKLTPQNQKYLMSLIQVAAVAERGVKRSLAEQLQEEAEKEQDRVLEECQ